MAACGLLETTGMETHNDASPRRLTQSFAMVAVWQFLCFVVLIAFVWAAEVLDIKHLVYDTPQEPVDWLKAGLLTAAIIAVAIVTVGHTHLQEKRILRGYFIVCSYCHKVQIENKAWQQMEAYVSDKTEAEFTHGICPHCYERAMKELAATPKPEG